MPERFGDQLPEGVPARDHQRLRAELEDAMRRGDYEEALRLARAAEAQAGPNEPLRVGLAGTYIDCGSGLGDRSLIEEGIARLESHQPRQLVPNDESSSHLLYNLANAFAARQHLRWSELTADGMHGLSLDEDSRRQKSLYRRAALGPQPSDVLFAAKRHVNFGNTLDHLGRSIEAIDEYEAALATSPDFPSALARSARVFFGTSHLAGRERMAPHFVEIADRAEKAIHHRDLLAEVSGPRAVEVAEREYAEVMEYFSSRGGLPRARAHVIAHEERSRRSASAFPDDAHNEFSSWAAQRLFLTHNARQTAAPCYWVDDVMPSEILVPSADSPDTLLRLLDQINEMKSAYAAARSLLTDIDVRRQQLVTRGLVGRFALRDRPVDWTLVTALRKTTYRVAADVLDKAAMVLNTLYGWIPRERDVAFVTLWYQHRDPA